MATFDLLVWIPLVPLLGSALIALIGPRSSKETVTSIALLAVFWSFLLTCFATYTMVQKGGALENVLYTWLAIDRFSIDLAFGLDPLSATLMLVVTGVGFLIHLYSTGYMEEDPAYWRYFSYLNLFIAAMSVLVLGRSLPVLFIGWEGVGLASYLLIGFWYSDDAKAKAGRKAFIVNRIGDFGFLIGTFTLLGLFGTADFVELKRAVGQLGASGTSQVLSTGIFAGSTVGGVITFACICLFVGACGKSAQLPLYVWLPDAMAGPTPVSALIHAATMVTAGVYMVARMGFLFDLAPAALTLMAWVGALTAVFAATIGLAQDDIKKVLAYSTVSQLGYMFLAAGCGAYSVAMFHVVTHAFFKACLFLGSGAVIHALHGEQDMRRMGGLRTLLRPVFLTFAISTLALAGFPLTSGFFSKDAILAHAFEKSAALGIMGAIGAFLTAFYMSRLVALTFFGKLRHPDPDTAHHLHHPGFAMTLPLWILAVLALVGGALSLPHIVHPPWSLEHFLEPVVGLAQLELSGVQEAQLMGGSSLIAIVGLILGYSIYKNGPSEAVEQLTRNPAVGVFARLLANKWYVDEIYDVLVVRPIRFVGSVAASLVDPWVIDGVLVKLIPGGLIKNAGRLLRRPQNGNVQSYATFFVIGAIVFCFVWGFGR